MANPQARMRFPPPHRVHFPANLPDQVARGLGRAAGCQKVVDNQHPLSAADGIVMPYDGLPFRG